ncbi:hypothetical protein BDW62DRAFT_199359 [Aspergillus aurantiobrunneus]
MKTGLSPDYETLPSHILTPAPGADKNPLLFINLAELAVSEEAKVISNILQTVEDQDKNGPTALIQLWRPPKSAFLLPPAHAQKYIPNVTTRIDNDHIRVFARRRTIGNKGDRDILNPNKTHCVELVDIIGRNSMTQSKQFAKWGIELHDPTREVFTPNTGTATRREELKLAASEALSESTPLPTELVAQVVNRLYDDDEQIFEILSLADIQRQVDRYVEELKQAQAQGKQDEEDDAGNVCKCGTEDTENEEEGEEVDGFGSFEAHGQNEDDGFSESSSDNEPDSDSSSDSDFDDQDNESFLALDIEFPEKLAVHLIPWKYDHVANRIDLNRYGKLIHGQFECPVNFLLAPMSPKDENLESASTPQTSPFGTVYHGGDGFMLISRNTIERMVRYALDAYCAMLRAWELRGEIHRKKGPQVYPAETELLHEPEQPLYFALQPWSMAEHGEGIVLVFVTNSLTDSQIEEIKGEVETRGEYEPESDAFQKICHIVPWTDSDQGTPDRSFGDIWKLICELQGEGFQLPLFFADKQSGTDLKLVMVDTDTIPRKDDNEEVCEFMPRVGDPHIKRAAIRPHCRS